MRGKGYTKYYFKELTKTSLKDTWNLVSLILRRYKLSDYCRRWVFLWFQKFFNPVMDIGLKLKLRWKWWSRFGSAVIHDSISIMSSFQNFKRFCFDNHREVYVYLNNISVSHSVITIVQKSYRGKTASERFLICLFFSSEKYLDNIFTVFQHFWSKFCLKWKKKIRNI